MPQLSCLSFIGTLVYMHAVGTPQTNVSYKAQAGSVYKYNTSLLTLRTTSKADCCAGSTDLSEVMTSARARARRESGVR
ncbi:hypothetical protein B0H16DRAFT_1513515 [Mycena metata]|uniref:Secreted protein n=1 Tax=Mycena metata TaxID=1033252 RepID=A0AAD7NRR7_9AGAR|nr:hypothetical protein B0H16DRAFT_1513515 [Mycena metata]